MPGLFLDNMPRPHCCNPFKRHCRRVSKVEPVTRKLRDIFDGQLGEFICQSCQISIISNYEARYRCFDEGSSGSQVIEVTIDDEQPPSSSEEHKPFNDVIETQEDDHRVTKCRKAKIPDYKVDIDEFRLGLSESIEELKDLVFDADQDSHKIKYLRVLPTNFTAQQIESIFQVSKALAEKVEKRLMKSSEKRRKKCKIGKERLENVVQVQ